MKATHIVFWPGKEVPACDEHTQKLRALGAFMGFGVSAMLCMADRECTNCQNELAAARAQQPESDKPPATAGG